MFTVSGSVIHMTMNNPTDSSSCLRGIENELISRC